MGMATVPFTAAGGDVISATWTPLAQNDDGQAFEQAAHADRSVQVSGVFGGATVLLEGTIDGANYGTLTDPQGNNLSFTSARIEQVSELVRLVRPRVVGGDGTTAVRVDVLMRRR